MSRRGARRCRRLIAAATALLGGCASPGPLAETAQAPPDWLKRFVNTDNGLELRRWDVADDPRRIGAALMQFAGGPVLDPQRVWALRRNGLRFVRVRADQVDALLDALGPTSLDLSAWHGQIVQWRNLLELRIEGGDAAIAVDGHAERCGPGHLRLMARAWTVQTERGALLNLELLPKHQPPRSLRLQRLLGERAPPGRLFWSLALEVQLEPGFAYVLTGASPQAEWTAPGTAAGIAGVERQVPAPGLGPAADAPPTLGELFFTGGEPPRRSMLVFLPRIPDGLLSPPQVAAERAAAEDGVSDAAPR